MPDPRAETLRSAAIDRESGERVHELVPRPRVVGPGRRERAYLAKQAELERELALRVHALSERSRELAQTTSELERRENELAAAALCERGAQRAADRLERRLEATREDAEALRASQNRLLVALGALQRENELLRERLASGGARAIAATPTSTVAAELAFDERAAASARPDARAKARRGLLDRLRRAR